jgi:hypothetical protein
MYWSFHRRGKKKMINSTFLLPHLGLYGPTCRDTFNYKPFDLDPARYGITPEVVREFSRAVRELTLVHINQILLQIGYIKIVDPPLVPTSIHCTAVGWGESLLWADEGGGLTLNCRGRQRTGAICIIDYYRMRYRLSTGVVNRLKPLIGVLEAVIPQERWQTCNGIPPDVLIRADGYYFTDLVGVAGITTPPTEELLDEMAVGRIYASLY